jgi:hypothetical protein
MFVGPGGPFRRPAICGAHSQEEGAGICPTQAAEHTVGTVSTRAGYLLAGRRQRQWSPEALCALGAALASTNAV